MLLAATQQVVAGDDPLGRAGQAPIAVETRPDEALVGQVGTAEHARDPLEERRLGHRSGGRQQAEDAPFDTIGEGRGGVLEVVRVGQPPAIGLDLGQAPLGRPAELLADERQQALHGVRIRVPIARLAPRAAGRARRRRRGQRTRRRRRPARARTPRAPGDRRRMRRRLGGRPSWPVVVGGIVDAIVVASRGSCVGIVVDGRTVVVRSRARRRLRPSPRRPPARGSRWPGGAAVRPGPTRRGSRRAAARSGPARPGRAASRPPSRSPSARRRPPRTVVGRSVPVARTGPWPERGRGRPLRRAAGRGRRSPGSAARVGGGRRAGAARRWRPRPRRDPTSAR